MSKEYAVEFNNVSKIYKLKKKNENKGSNIIERFYAIKDISFKVEKGEIVGVLGTNGSGKSTMSKILAGVSDIDEGSVIINGEQALIAIKSGLKNQLTGMENIELKGAMLGFSKKKIKEISEDIVEFSELGDFINQPVKSYSSGMKSRLGFAISINMNPEIVIIDEALSVGDSTFNDKCYHKIQELKNQGRTIFFVSHSIGELKKYCTKGLWIEGGTLIAYDDISTVSKEYTDYINTYKAKSKEEQKNIRTEKQENRIIKEPYIEIKKKSRKNKLMSLICVITIAVITLVAFYYLSR